jgi:hypothetical protein
MKSPDCRLEWTLLPLTIAGVFEGPIRERSLRLVMELEVSERESSMPRGRAGAIAQLKNDVLGRRFHRRISMWPPSLSLVENRKQKKRVCECKMRKMELTFSMS